MKQLLFTFLILFSCLAKAQQTEANNDCTFSKEIIIPFNNSADGTNKVKPPLNQTVFYSYRDQFSYWYKIIVKEDITLRFKVNTINDSDEYVVYVYQYNEKDFCDKVFYHKIKALKSAFFIGNNSLDDPYDLSEKSFSAKKDNTYYISVLNTSINNCGHTLYLIDQKDTLRVKALHLPCKRDMAITPIKPVNLNTSIKKQDTIIAKIIMPVVSKKDSLKKDNIFKPILICKVINAIKKISVEGNLLLTEKTTNQSLPLIETSKGIWNTDVEIGKTYKIKCTAFGYKNFEQTITITTLSNNVDVLLEPFKEGETFVMKTIYFFPNTYALKKSSGEELEKLVHFLHNNPSIRIEIQGHTNADHHIAKNKAYKSLGEEWNFEGSAKLLSQKRAETIKKFLETNGIDANRLEAKGYGGKKPIIKDPQNNEEGQMNIRVEVSILKS